MTNLPLRFARSWRTGAALLLGATLSLAWTVSLRVEGATAGTCWQDDYVEALYRTLINVDPGNPRQVAVVDSFMTDQLHSATTEAMKASTTAESAGCWFSYAGTLAQARYDFRTAVANYQNGVRQAYGEAALRWLEEQDARRHELEVGRETQAPYTPLTTPPASKGHMDNRYIGDPYYVTGWQVGYNGGQYDQSPYWTAAASRSYRSGWAAGRQAKSSEQ